MPQRAVGLDSLPDDLLGRCLGLLPLEEGHSITLVCKRFRRLFFEQPSLWRSFRVAFACHPDCYVEAKHALLRRVAPLVHDFVLLSNEEQACNRKATDFFGLLPDSLPGLQLRYECTAVPPAVRRLLRRLSLSGVLLPATLPDALTGLPQLEQLELSIYQCFDPARIMAAVAQLGRLTQLQLYSWGSARLHPPPPAAFPRLTTYTFHSAKFPVKFVGGQCRSCSLSPADFGGNPLSCLRLVGAEPAGSLAQLLDVAVPPSVQLQALWLERGQYTAAAVQGCTQLAALQGLHLYLCDFDAAIAVEFVAACSRLTALHLIAAERRELAAMLSQPLPQLQALRLHGGFHSLPPQLAQLTNLRRLEWLGYRKPSTNDLKLLCCLPHLHTLALNPWAMGSRRGVPALSKSLPGVKVVQA